MIATLTFSGFKIKSLALVLALAIGAAALVGPKPAQAHCDSVNGPVVGAAREALEKDDVRPVLAYVQPGAEAELTAAFNQAIEVRRLGGSAQQLAETYFFETAVRLHRAGEGASYTGLKYESDFGPALEAAEQALQTDSVKAVNSLLEQAWRDGVATRFQAVQDLRSSAARLGTVESERERAEAELLFEKYVLGLYNAATGEVAHGEGEAVDGHGTAAALESASAGEPQAVEGNASPYPAWY